MGRAYVFRRKIGVPTPSGSIAGHVGWAFQLDSQSGFYCGSTENPDAAPWHGKGEDNGWWAETVASEDDIFAHFQVRHYDDYKLHDMLVTLAEPAKRVADNSRDIGYSFTGNNCLDHTYSILSHYGAIDLPLPFDACCYPNSWFDVIKWVHKPLNPPESSSFPFNLFQKKE